jgi:FKBP-type peptidyl-prolyl cis-trans isomerase FklB
MKSQIILFATCAAFISQARGADPATDLKTDRDKASYSIGQSIGSNMKKQGVDIDPAMVAAGLKDAFTGAKSKMTEQEMSEALEAFQRQMMAKKLEKDSAVGGENKKKGEAFLAENKKKEGVKALPSGLQYQVIREGTGEMPKATDTVTTHYRGTLLDGTEFDSSYKRNEPASFPLNGVIKGWTEALQLMKTGSKWRLFVPAELAYGERGAGQDIPPNSTLIFEVELISIQK